MAEPAPAERCVEGRALDGRGTLPRVGNPGTYLGYVEVGGQRYAKFSAQPGTWVSSSMKSMGYERVYPAKDAYGAYRGLVLDPEGKPLADPDRIRPGDQYLVPEQTTRGAPAREPATAPPPAAAAVATPPVAKPPVTKPPVAKPPVTKPPVSAPPAAPAVASRGTAGKGLLQSPVPARDIAVEQRGGGTSSRPAPRTSAGGLSPEEQVIDDAIGDMLSRVLTGWSLRSHDLTKALAPDYTPWYYSPAATLAAFGRMLDFYWSLLAYINPDFGVTYGEREEARRTLKTVVFESLTTFMPLQQEVVRRARQARETARQNPDSDAADAALVEAATAAREALMLEHIAATRLLLASFMAASWDDSGRLTTIPDDYKREWELVRDESQPVIDAIARQDHAVAMQAGQQFEYQFDALRPRLAKWREKWQRYQSLEQAFAATMTVASLVEFFWTIGTPPIGPFGTPPAALAGVGGLRLTPMVEATSQLGRSALIVAMAANSGTGGGTPPRLVDDVSRGLRKPAKAAKATKPKVTALSPEELKNVARLGSRELNKIAQLDQDALRRFAQLDNDALAYVADLNPPAIEWLSKLRPEALKKLASARITSPFSLRKLAEQIGPKTSLKEIDIAIAKAERHKDILEKAFKATESGDWTKITGKERSSIGRHIGYELEETARAIASGGRAKQVLNYELVNKRLMAKLEQGGGRVLITQGRLRGGDLRFDIAEIDFDKRTGELIDLAPRPDPSHIAGTELYEKGLSKLLPGDFTFKTSELHYVGEEGRVLEKLEELPIK